MYDLDFTLLRWANSWVFQKEWWDALIVFRVDWLPYWVIAGLLVFGLLPFFLKFRQGLRRNWQMIFTALAAGLIARFGVVELIRLFYDRPRPFDLPAEALAEAGVRINQLIFHNPGHSFPSGHASFFFALAAVIGRYYPKTSILFFGAAISLSFSRVVAGIHWPSDVLGGAVIGVVIGFSTVSAWRRYARSRNSGS